MAMDISQVKSAIDIRINSFLEVPLDSSLQQVNSALQEYVGVYGLSGDLGRLLAAYLSAMAFRSIVGTRGITKRIPSWAVRISEKIRGRGRDEYGLTPRDDALPLLRANIPSDHTFFTKAGDYVSEPYNVSQIEIEKMIEFCHKYGLEFSISGASAHFPEATLRMIVKPRKREGRDELDR